ncbi:hypothetical protein C0213_03630 [Latilactobacillus sakei]|nr:hypothetical protein C0213_03630 [Latilactobacillus sakei]
MKRLGYFFWIIMSLILFLQISNKIVLGQTNNATSQERVTIKNTKSKLTDVKSTDIDDGITNWKESGKTTASSIMEPSYPNKGLIYSFGTLVGGEDSSQDSKIDSSTGLIINGQPNVGILDNNKIESIYYNGASKINANGNSMAFGLVFDPNAPAGRISKYSVLINKLQNKKYYLGQDGNNTVMKIMGDFNRDGHQFIIEILLRPEKTTDKVVVNQEMFIKNIGTTDESFGVFYGGDVAVAEDDRVAMQSLGNNEGLYLEGAAGKYKLLLEMDQQYGPSDFVGSPLNQKWLSGFSGATFNGQGIVNTPIGLTPGATVIPAGNDTTYTLKWPYQTLAPGGVYHVVHGIQGLIGEIVRPVFSKTYQNLTSKDGKNRINDTVKFDVSLKNLGFQDRISGIKIQDQITDDFKLDPSSIVLVKADGSKEKVPESAYNTTTKELLINVKDKVADNKIVSIEYDASIAPQAAGKEVTNTANLDCIDDIGGQAFKRQATVKFYVEKANYLDQVTKLVRNDSQKEQNYQSTTQAANGDKVSYQINYHVDANSPSGFASGTLVDNLPAELNLNGPITVSYSDGTTQTVTDLKNLKLNPMKKGESVKVAFSAIVNASKSKVIRNTVSVIGQSNAGDSIKGTDYADLNLVVPAAKIKHELKNETTPDKDFGEVTEGNKGDVISYRFTINDFSSTQKQAYLEKITDQTNDLELVKDSIQIKYTPKQGSAISWNVNQAGQDEFKNNHRLQLTNGNVIDFEKGDKVIVTYKMKITTPDLKKVIINNGTYNAKAGVTAPIKSNDTKITTKSGMGQVTFRYIDRKTGQSIGDKEVIVTGPFGKKVSELTSNETSGHQDPNKIRPAYIQDYVAVDYTDELDLSHATYYRPQDIDPVIDQKPQVYTIRYERSGLNFSAPKKFEFGEYLANPSDATYYLKALKDNQGQKVPYNITISDYYGVKDWSLGVKQNKQFEASIANNQGNQQTVQLDRAKLRFKNASFSQLVTDSQNTATDQSNVINQFQLTPGEPLKTLVNYHKNGKYVAGNGDNNKNQQYDNPGFSTYSYQFGDQKDADNSISLHVPATTKRYKTRYTSQLTWTLTVAP